MIKEFHKCFALVIGKLCLTKTLAFTERGGQRSHNGSRLRHRIKQFAYPEKNGAMRPKRPRLGSLSL